MTHHSAASLLVLHAVRLLGFADSEAVAERAGTSHADTLRLLSAAEHAGWMQHVAFADLDGWSLTDSGKAENERQLMAERVSADPDCVVAATYCRESLKRFGLDRLRSCLDLWRSRWC